MSKGIKTVYTDAQLQFVSDNRTMTIAGLHKAFCEKFGRTDVSKHTLKSLRLRNGWLTGRGGQFVNGHTAWNKGTHFKAPGIEKHLFKPGHKPANSRPEGSERVNCDGYVEIKNDAGKWVLKHRHIWQQANGPVPKGYVLIFRDNDKLNVTLSNLMLITRGELVVMNKAGLGSYAGEAKDTALLMARLKIKQRELLKKKRA